MLVPPAKKFLALTLQNLGYMYYLSTISYTVKNPLSGVTQALVVFRTFTFYTVFKYKCIYSGRGVSCFTKFMNAYPC